MVDDSAARYFAAAAIKPFAFDWSVTGNVPVSRGLGSSVTIRHGVLQGLNELCGRPLEQEDLFRICMALEGHPDNAGAAAFGGFFACNAAGNWSRFEVDSALKFVLLVPELEVLTEKAREVLPVTIPLRDAVENMGHACAITAAFASRRYEKLAGCFADTIHQRQRAHLVPGLFDVIEAGVRAGALGGFLSGSGSTIAGVVWQADPAPVAAAMAGAWRGSAPVDTLITSADNSGAQAIAE
jgi:homoserine kinase